jgi:hypothetical protein
VVYTSMECYSAIKRLNPVIWGNRDGTWIYYVKWNISGMDGQTLLILTDIEKIKNWLQRSRQQQIIYGSMDRTLDEGIEKRDYSYRGTVQ